MGAKKKKGKEDTIFHIATLNSFRTRIRQRIHDGWLVSDVVQSDLLGFSTSSTFVKDKDSKWELTQDSNEDVVFHVDKYDGFSRTRRRQPIYGGWLVSDMVTSDTLGISTSIEFIEDKSHSWELDEN